MNFCVRKATWKNVPVFIPAATPFYIFLWLLHCPHVFGAFVGSDFSNNLISDLAPILALFGEQVSKQFLASSTTWEDTIIFAMAPIGIITGIVAAIRIGGPIWLKSVVGRARENLAMAEVELTTSTSQDVCELWNGTTVVRMIGSPSILQLVLLPGRCELPDLGLFTLKDGISKGIFPPRPTVHVVPYDNWICRLYKPSTTSNPDVVNEAKRTPVSSMPLRDIPNLFLNLQTPSSAYQQQVLRLWTVFSVCVQAGILFFSAFVTYHSKLKDETSPIEGYAYPLTATGTLMLIGGLVICVYIVESSTTEEFWSFSGPGVCDAGPKMKGQIFWLQKGGNINDQNFDSYAVFAGGFRKGIWTSRLMPALRRFSIAQLTQGIDSPSIQASDPEALYRRKSTSDIPGHHFSESSFQLQVVVTIGTLLTVTGFISQFIGLRALHWSASIAHLSGTLIMVMVRTWIRRESTTPKTYKTTKGYELDSLAIMLTEGNIIWDKASDRKAHMKFNIETMSQQDPLEAANKTHNETFFDDHQEKNNLDQRNWELEIDTDSGLDDLQFDRIPEDIRLSRIPETGNHKSSQYVNRVIKVRERLGHLSEWTGPASEPAISITNAIEVVLNTLLGDVDANVMHWNLPLKRENFQSETISLVATRDSNGDAWKIKASALEAVLSLWIYSVETSAAIEPGYTNRLPQNEKKTMGQDWLRDGNAALRRNTLRLLGPPTKRCLRELNWYLRSLIHQEFEIGEGLRKNVNRVTEEQFYQFKTRFQAPNSEKLTDHLVIEASRVTGSRLPDLDIVDEKPLLAIGVLSQLPLETFYAQEIFASFMWAISKAIDRLGGKTIVLPRSDNSSWKDIRVENSTLSNLWAKVEKVWGPELGPTDHMYYIILHPLIQFNKLPGPSEYLLPYALDLASVNEKANNWTEATEIYLWLLNISEHSLSHNDDMKAHSYGAVMRFGRYLRDLIKYDQFPTRNKNVIAYCLGKLKGPQQSRIFNHTTTFLSMTLPYMQPGAVRDLLQFLYMLQLMPKTLRKIRNSTKNHQILADINRLEPVNNLCLTQLHRIILKLSLSPHDNQELLNLINNNYAESPDSIVWDCTGWTPLHYAVRIEHKDAVKFLSRQATHRLINTSDIVGKTLLHYTRTFAITEILLQAGAQANTQARDGSSPLHSAVIEAAATNKLVEESEEVSETTYIRAIDEIRIVSRLIEVGAGIDNVDNARRTPLHWAAYIGSSNLIKLLIERGANIMARENRGRTPLHLATTQDRLTQRIFRPFQSDFDFEVVDDEGSTPLYYAIRRGWQRSAKILIAKKAGTEGPNIKEDRQRPLHLAIRQRFQNLVLDLIKAKANVNAMTSKGVTPLHMATKDGLKEIVEVLFEAEDLDVNVENRDGDTALELAIRHEYHEISKMLIQRYNLNEKVGLILNFACSSGDERLVKRLVVDIGANIEGDVKTNISPALHSAVQFSNSSIARILLKEGQANVNAKDNDGTAPLHLACRWGKEDSIRMLVNDYQADINVCDNRGWTPLHFACESGRRTSASILVTEGKANVESRTFDNGYTPLHFASKHGSEWIVTFLVAEGKANVEARTKDGNTPLHLACIARRDACVVALLEEGADINARNGENLTPLDIAKSKNYNGIANILLKNNGKQTSEL